MKKRYAVALASTAAAIALIAQSGHAQDKMVDVKLQLKWFPQAQFAGFMVAKEKGYFKDEGLNVTLLPAGDQSPIQVLQTGGADFGTTWIADLLTAREKGAPVVHISQIFQKSGFTLVSLKKSGINKLEDLKGKKIGVWPAGNEYPAVAALKKVGLTSSLDAGVASPDVQAVTYPFDPSLVFPDKVDAVAAMTYNEVNQIIGLGYPYSQLKVMKLADYGINLLEDLVFTTEKVLAEKDFKGSGMSGKEVAAKLVRASIKGWNYAVKNQAEAVSIVLPQCGNTCKGSGTRADAKGHQTWQMKEIGLLYNAGPTLRGWGGYLEPAAYKASVKILRDQGILTKEPDAKTVDYSVWEMATGRKAMMK